MNKKRNAICIALSGILASTVLFAAVGCGGKSGNDPEKRPLKLSTNAPDGVFNPFYSTSAVDANVISHTQIGLLSTDKNGNVVCGENEPSVALDYSINEKTEGGQTYTYYQFIIKNGIKFSDGEPLTIKDVLFNLYVYLDPVYTGSATLYSTKIDGLNAYRTQDPNASDTSASTVEEGYRKKAEARISRLTDYVKINGIYNNKPTRDFTADEETMAKKDFQTVSEAFRTELVSDYNAVSASFQSYKDNNGFTEIWQAFLANNGFELYQKEADGETLKKNENGNYLFDPNGEAKNCEKDLNDYLAENNLQKTDEAVRAFAVDYVFSGYIGTEIATTYGDPFEAVCSYSNTAQTILSKFTAEEMEADNAKYKNGLAVPTITGIKGGTDDMKGDKFEPSVESRKQSAYSGDYDMLQVKVKGVDPKAIYNFGISIAPLHYYSSHAYTSSRTGEVTDYINGFDAASGNFGVAFRETGFMDNVIKAADKIGVPVGAGAYMATDLNGSDTAKGDGFFSNNVIYFKRNDYFKTVGSGLSNAKIRLLRYSVVNSDQIITSLKTRAIDYGDPSATQTNLNEVKKDSSLKGAQVWTNGYGYVGINARFVPNITVRRAIMKAMDLSIITREYYQGGLAEIIYRSMSSKSWAYPEGATVYTSKDNGTSYKYDPNGDDIKAMLKTLESQGYQKNSNGVYTKGKDTLDYTFTIAGGSTDHPAYSMFLNAMQILNQKDMGIHVKIETSQTALTDLSSGKLAIWAAAWTSAIDPDMYQVYHKDSKASSIKNWGYDYILADADTYSYEQVIIGKLSTVIDSARQTTNKELRKSRYKEALDYVMELAVELPTYQRKDLFVFNSKVLDEKTMQHGDEELTPYNGPLSRIWEVNYR